jgi:hypothetical protein
MGVEMHEFNGYFDVMFEIRALGYNLTLFNKEPIRIQAITANLPPIGALGVSREGQSVALYNRAAPDGPPIGKMLYTRKKVGAYVDLSYKARRNALDEARSQRTASDVTRVAVPAR